MSTGREVVGFGTQLDWGGFGVVGEGGVFGVSTRCVVWVYI